MALESLTLRNFAGGLDLRSSIPNVDIGYTPDCNNFEITEKGGLVKVLGFSNFATASEDLERIIPYQKGDGSSKVLIGVSKNKVFTYNAAGIETTIHTWPSANDGDISFAFYKDEVYIADGTNDMISWDGSTITSYPRGSSPTYSGPPVGHILGIWNSRMYFCPSSDKMRVEISRLGEFDKWDENEFFNISVNSDGQAITGGIVSEGKLIVTTQDNILEVYSSVGANRVGDTSIGCVSRKSLRAINGVVFGVSKKGVFEYSNLNTIMATEKVEPLFLDSAPELSSSAGEHYKDRYLASYQRPTNNYITLDIYPSFDNAVMRNDYPMFDCAISDITSTKEELFFIDSRNKKKIRKGFNTGSFLAENDARTDIKCYYETAHINMGSDLQLKRLYRMRVVGSGGLFVSLKTDYQDPLKKKTSLDFVSAGGSLWDIASWNKGSWSAASNVWDGAIWDQTNWGGYALEEKIARITSRARIFSFYFEESGRSTGVGRNVLGQPSNEISNTALYLVEPRFVTTGRTR